MLEAQMMSADGLSARTRAMSASTVCLSASSVLRDHQSIGDRGLLDRFLLAIESALTVDGIHCGDDITQPVMMTKHRIGGDRGKHGQRIGQPGGFDHQPAIRWDRTAIPFGVELPQGSGQITTNCAAQTSGLEQYRGFI